MKGAAERITTLPAPKRPTSLSDPRFLAGLASLVLFNLARRRGPEPGSLVESEAPA